MKRYFFLASTSLLCVSLNSLALAQPSVNQIDSHKLVIALKQPRKDLVEISNGCLTQNLQQSSKKPFVATNFLSQAIPSLPPGTTEPTRSDLELVPKTEFLLEEKELEIQVEQPDFSLPTSTINTTFLVNRVEILGSTAFSIKELEQVTKPFIGKRLTFEQLFSLRTAVTRLYIDHGYRTSGVFLPPQRITNGTVQVQVVEGDLERVEITGLKYLNEDYVRSRISEAAQVPLNINRIEAALQLLQLNPLFERVDGEIIAGTSPGRSVLVLNLQEVVPFTSALQVDNYASPSIGSLRAAAILNYNNLFGLGDRLNAEFGITEGTNTYDINYQIPVNPREGTIGLRYTRGRSRVIEQPFALLDIKGRSETYSISFREPLDIAPNKEFALSLSAELRRSRTFLFDDRPFSFTEGPEDGESQVSVLRFSQDWVERKPNRVLAARSQFSFGLDAFGATINDSGTDGRFFNWLGQFQWVQVLNEEKDAIAIARIAAQLTGDSLLPLEQISIGGINTVRGYRENAGVGDSGVIGSLELRLPVIRDPNGIGLVHIAPFFDLGTVWSNNSDNSSQTLVGTGLGLQWQLGNLVTRLDWGIPLVPVANRGDSLQDSGLSFSLQWQPF